MDTFVHGCKVQSKTWVCTKSNHKYIFIHTDGRTVNHLPLTLVLTVKYVCLDLKNNPIYRRDREHPVNEVARSVVVFTLYQKINNNSKLQLLYTIWFRMMREGF